MSLNVIWALFGLSAIGALLCARTRAATPALFFGVLAVVLFMATPFGSELPQNVLELFQNTANSPAQAGSR